MKLSGIMKIGLACLLFLAVMALNWSYYGATK